MVINVEYNQLDPLLRASGYPDGDVNCETGYSPYPGNINQVILFHNNILLVPVPHPSATLPSEVCLLNIYSWVGWFVTLSALFSFHMV